MIHIGIRDLKNQATEILRAVREEKAEYIVTYRGLPVARLTPLRDDLSAGERQAMVEQAPARSELIAEIDHVLNQKCELPLQHRRTLKIMREWLAAPDEDSPGWWDEFNAQLEQNRFRLRQAGPLA